MASKTRISRSIAITSVPPSILGVCTEILSELKAKDFSEEDIFAVHLAVQEAFLNAIQHGNGMDVSKKVKIDYSIDTDRVEISMSDEGNGFDPEGVPDPRVGENLYKIEGRGLLLMRSYMDEVRFSRRGNCVHMVRYKEKPPLKESQSQRQA